LIPLSEQFLNISKDITEGYDKACGSWSIDSQLLHIISEVAEVKDVVRNKNNKYGETNSDEYMSKLYDEVADVFLTSVSLVNILDISNSSLNNAILKKLKTVQERLRKIQVKIS